MKKLLLLLPLLFLGSCFGCGQAKVECWYPSSWRNETGSYVHQLHGLRLGWSADLQGPKFQDLQALEKYSKDNGLVLCTGGQK